MGLLAVGEGEEGECFAWSTWCLAYNMLPGHLIHHVSNQFKDPSLCEMVEGFPCGNDQKIGVHNLIQQMWRGCFLWNLRKLGRLLEYAESPFHMSDWIFLL